MHFTKKTVLDNRSNLIKNLSSYLNENSIIFNQCLLVIDKKVPKKLINNITRALKRKKVFKFNFDANEKNKNIKYVNEILKILLNKNFSRQDCLITIGGGITGQAEAIRLGVSRILSELDTENRSALKPSGLLTRAPRMVERKKFGQKKARKKFQFSKR